MQRLGQLRLVEAHPQTGIVTLAVFQCATFQHLPVFQLAEHFQRVFQRLRRLGHIANLDHIAPQQQMVVDPQPPAGRHDIFVKPPPAARPGDFQLGEKIQVDALEQRILERLVERQIELRVKLIALRGGAEFSIADARLVISQRKPSRQAEHDRQQPGRQALCPLRPCAARHKRIRRVLHQEAIGQWPRVAEAHSVRRRIDAQRMRRPAHCFLR